MSVFLCVFLFVCECVSVCVSVCLRVSECLAFCHDPNMQLNSEVFLFLRLDTYNTHIYTYKHVHTHIHIHTLTYTHIYIHMHTQMRIACKNNGHYIQRNRQYSSLISFVSCPSFLHVILIRTWPFLVFADERRLPSLSPRFKQAIQQRDISEFTY